MNPHFYIAQPLYNIIYLNPIVKLYCFVMFFCLFIFQILYLYKYWFLHYDSISFLNVYIIHITILNVFPIS